MQVSNDGLHINNTQIPNAPVWREVIVVVTSRYAGAFFELRNVIIFIDLLLFRIYVDENYLFDI